MTILDIKESINFLLQYIYSQQFKRQCLSREFAISLTWRSKLNDPISRETPLNLFYALLLAMWVSGFDLNFT